MALQFVFKLGNFHALADPPSSNPTAPSFQCPSPYPYLAASQNAHPSAPPLGALHYQVSTSTASTTIAMSTRGKGKSRGFVKVKVFFDTSKGHLTAAIHEGRAFAKAAHPVVRVALTPDAKKTTKQKTKPAEEKSVNPVWNEGFRWPLHDTRVCTCAPLYITRLDYQGLSLHIYFYMPFYISITVSLAFLLLLFLS